jgi:photosystem II oxygen-evolving enhancer protein 3
MGTLRFDLNTLATAKTGKEEKKAALALRKEFIRSVSTQMAPDCCVAARQMDEHDWLQRSVAA